MTASNAASINLLSLSLAPEVAADVRSIDGSMARFATDFMAQPGIGAATRLEATKNQAGLWTIDRFTRLTDIDGGATKQEPELRSGICFFDALDYLARFQNTESELGKQTMQVSGERWNVMHFREAAAESGQPFDKEGQVQPCIAGRIVTGGFFNDDQYDVAAKTMNDPLPDNHTKPPAPHLSLLSHPTENTETGTNLAVMGQALSNAEQIHAAKTVLDKGQTLINSLQNIITPPDVVYTTLLTVVSIGYHRYIAPKADVNPKGAFNAAMQVSSAMALKLPDGLTKTLVGTFNTEAQYTFWIIEAAHRYNTDGKSRDLHGSAQKCLPFLEKAAQAKSMTAAETDIFKSAFLSGKIIAEKTLEGLKEIWREAHFSSKESPEEKARKEQSSVQTSLKKLIEKLET